MVTVSKPGASGVAFWIRDDADGQRWLASYGEHPNWWRLIVGDAYRYGWIFVEDDFPHAFVDLEIVGEVAYVAMFVRPASRNRGVGRRVLHEVGGLAAELGALRMEGGVDPMAPMTASKILGVNDQLVRVLARITCRVFCCIATSTRAELDVPPRLISKIPATRYGPADPEEPLQTEDERSGDVHSGPFAIQR